MRRLQLYYLVGVVYLFIFLTFNLRYVIAQEWPEYNNNPFIFSVVEPILDEQFFVVDLNSDGLLDFTYRTLNSIYGYDHYGTLLWQTALENPGGGNTGTKHAASDVDGDGQIEIIALNRNNQLFLLNGLTGAIESTTNLPVVGSNCRWIHVQVVNFRGKGDRDIIVQSLDTTGVKKSFYVNRSLLAFDLENKQELWRVEQDADHSNGIYEGYWSPAHNAFQCADVDGDGRDEVVGGNMIDDNGTVIELNYPRDWVGVLEDGFTDHLDAIAIGDYRPDIPGLEWLVCEEDHAGGSDWHTTMMSKSGIVWRNETNLFSGNGQEPQSVLGGNFDVEKSHTEVFARSRFVGPNDSQHPWIFDALGVQFADFATENVLPDGFNTHEYGNKEGLEMISAIDWFGGSRDYIAAKARHVNGNIGVFDAVTGEAVWYTPSDFPETKATLIYVTDIAGDSREEVIIYDESGNIQIYWNAAENQNSPKARKWDDPLYNRIKQNWNYYSPSGYVLNHTGNETSLTVLSPNGGEEWFSNNKYKISWTSIGIVEFVRLEYSLDAGSHWFVITDSTENDGEYFWLIPDTISYECLIRISDGNIGDPKDVSDGLFSIVAESGSSEMEIVINCDDEYKLWINENYVGENDEWNVAQTYTIPILSGKNVVAVYGQNRGSGAGALIAEVRVGQQVVLITNENWRMLDHEESGWINLDYEDSFWQMAVSHGRYGVPPWEKNIEDFPSNSEAEWIWSEDLYDPQKTWYYRGSFEGGSSVPEPEISSFEPDSGEVGVEVAVFGNNFIGVSDVMFNGVSVSSYEVDSQSQIRAIVPENATSGSISVVASGGTTVSENVFVVVETPFIRVVDPNGGEKLTIDTLVDILWESSSNIDSVVIHYTFDNGISWQLITTTENSTSYSWVVPPPASSECFIKIANKDESISDISDNAFVITETEFDTIATNLTIEAENMHEKSAGYQIADGWFLDVDGYLLHKVYFESSGFYTFDYLLKGNSYQSIWPKVKVEIDTLPLANAIVDNQSNWSLYQFYSQIDQGAHQIKISYINDENDRELSIDKLEINSSSLHEENQFLSLANSFMNKIPNPENYSVMDWKIVNALYGILRAYQQSGESSYLDYIYRWADAHIDSQGNFDEGIYDIFTGGIVLELYLITKEERFLNAGLQVKDFLDNDIPRLSNGALVHMNEDQLWDDTLFGLVRFLLALARSTDDLTVLDEAAIQFILHEDVLSDNESGLFYHGWDEDGSADWADPTTHQSSEFWGRGNGWVVASLADLLEILPTSHPDRDKLLQILSVLTDGIMQCQNHTSNLWYTLLAKSEHEDNYLEVSASALFVYGLQKSLYLGFIDSSNQSVINLASDGLNRMIYQKENGDLYTTNISEGTNVGDTEYYLNRKIGDGFTYIFGHGVFLESKFEKLENHYHEKITVLSPNGGEQWPVESNQTINWSSVLLNSDVCIEYSANSGETWQLIVETTENDGKYIWQVPNSLTNSGLIRISNVPDKDVLDESDAVFSIVEQASEMEIVINCDDEYKLWINENYVGENDEWNVAQTYTIPILSGKNVVAVYGQNRGSGAGALIAEVRVGQQVVLITNENWRMLDHEESGWINLDYDDSFWQMAVSHGRYGVPPWEKNIENFPSNSEAEWIWSEDLYDPQKTWYYRGSFEGGSSDPEPEISSFEPDSGEVGVEVTVFGSNFIGVSAVKFNGVVSSSFIVDNETKLWAIVPSGATTGQISVVASGGTAVSSEEFVINFLPSLTLIIPNGGENWVQSSVQSIKWSSEGDIANVKLDYSVDGGTSWQEITDNTTNDGLFDWTVPFELTNAGKVRVSDALDEDPVDESDGTFSIVEQAGEMEIIINCDDEYELWVNSEYVGGNNLWDVAQIYVKSLISGANVLAVQGINQGGVGALIAEVKVNEDVLLLTNETWRRNATELEGWKNVDYDHSNWLFAISHGQYGVDPWKRNLSNFPENSQAEWIWSEDLIDEQQVWYFRGSFENGPPAPAPEITSFAPDSGEVGTEVTILGSNFIEVSSVKFNGVNSSNFIVDNENQLRAIVPENSSSGQISVVTSGGTAVSTEEFVVVVLPSLTITVPNGGENWLVGSVKTIQWDRSGEIASVRLEYSMNNGGDWTEIISSTANDGSYDWLIPSVESNSCLVRISDVLDGDPSDESDGVFLIGEEQGEMEVTINCDDEYELWVNGYYAGSNDQWDVAQTYVLSLQSGTNMLAVHGINGGGPGALISEVKVDNKIVLVTNSSWLRNATEESGWTEVGFDAGGWFQAVSHGKYGVDPWKRNISNFPENSQAEWIWSEDLIDEQQVWYFRGSFENGPPAPAPEITSFAPDSGEVGTEVTILGNNFIEVNAVKFNGESSSSYVVESETQLRTIVPEDATTGQISVVASGGIAVSSEEFVVVVLPGLTITVPNGGESWLTGSVQEITWTSKGEIDLVTLEYSLDNGFTWELIESGFLNDGFFEWMVVDSTSENCLIRVSDSKDANLMDVSDAVFSIVEQTNEMEIIINSDDQYQLWVNGNFIGEDDQWNVAQTYFVPVQAEKNVIAVHGWNRGSGAHGVIAEIKLNNEIVFLTDSNWLQTDSEIAGWTTIDFNDNDWQAVVDFGVYGTSPWQKNIQNFPPESEALWIWGENIRETYLRGAFEYHQLAKQKNQDQKIGANNQNIQTTIPEHYNLTDNFPNPFFSVTSISYQIPESQVVSIKIFDINGREIKTLIKDLFAPGVYAIIWNGTDNFGEKVVSGMYFYQMISGSFNMTKKLLVIR